MHIVLASQLIRQFGKYLFYCNDVCGIVITVFLTCIPLMGTVKWTRVMGTVFCKTILLLGTVFCKKTIPLMGTALWKMIPYKVEHMHNPIYGMCPPPPRPLLVCNDMIQTLLHHALLMFLVYWSILIIDYIFYL